jgi:hypothetical protein
VIHEVAIAITPDGVVTVTITADTETAHDIAQDLTSRMLGQPENLIDVRGPLTEA